MQKELLRLIGEELQLLRSEGLEEISVSEETLTALKEKFSETAGDGASGNGTDGGKQPPQSLPEMKKGASKSQPAEKKSKPTEVSDSQLSRIPVVDLPDGSKEEQWNWLKDRVLNCEVCKNHLNPGKKIVFGTGPLDAEIFFCGEAPGADEETDGSPFVGKAGQLLSGMLKAMKLSREDVYIANIMNWRPQTGSAYGNRPPNDEEMTFCLPYLKAQIQIVQPKVIVVLGGTAAKGLLEIETKGKMASLRGKWHEFSKIPTMVTYHPSFLLHQDSVVSKRKVWEDLLMVMEKLEMPITEKQKNFFLGALKDS